MIKAAKEGQWSIQSGGDTTYWLMQNNKIRFVTVGADDKENAEFAVVALNEFPNLVKHVEKLYRNLMAANYVVGCRAEPETKELLKKCGIII